MSRQSRNYERDKDDRKLSRIETGKRTIYYFRCISNYNIRADLQYMYLGVKALNCIFLRSYTQYKVMAYDYIRIQL